MSNVDEIKTELKSEVSSSAPKKLKRRKPGKIQDTFGDKVLEAITTVILFILLIIVAYPVIYVVSASFSSSGALLSGRVLLWPVEPTISAYQVVLGMDDILLGYRNTIFYTVVGTILQMFMQIVCAYPISKRNFQGRSVYTKIIVTTMLVSAGMIPMYLVKQSLGLIDNVVMYKAGRVREFLGFRYALYLPGILLNITAMWVYLRKDKVDLVGSLFWGVVNWYAYYMTDSRVSFLVAEGLLVLALLMKWLPKVVEKLRPLWAMLIPSFVLFGGVSVVMTMLYDWSVPWMRQINSLLDGRLNLGLYSINKYGITLFGQQIEWVGNGLDSAGNSVEATYDYVDNLYVKMLLRNGTIFTVLMAVFATWAMYRLWKRREYMILIICATVAVQGLLSDLSLALHFNTFWIAMGFSLFVPQNLDRSLPKTENDEPPGGDGPNDEDG